MAQKNTRRSAAQGRVNTARHPPAIPNDIGIAAFLAQVDLASVDRIDVICISGKVTLEEVCTALERAQHPAPPMRILMRSQSSSDHSRLSQEHQAVDRLKRTYSPRHEGFEIRHYACTSPLAGIICRHRDGTFSARLSFYDWRGTSAVSVRESTVPWCYTTRQPPAGEGLLAVYQSWFEHFWGKHTLHTLIFDFDDTIVFSTDPQVDAWVEAIQKAIVGNLLDIREFKDEFLYHDLHFGRRERMHQLFLANQEEKKIFEKVFRSGFPTTNQREFIRAARLGLRQQKTLEAARPIAEITQHLEALRHDYQLIIVSATSENYIIPVLEKHGLTGLFSYIFGREIEHGWTDIESKTPSFVRASSMTGIPLSRMCFVGDSDADYRAARQLGLAFIENRINAQACGLSSLITSREAGDHVVIDGSTHNGLLEAIERVSRSHISY